MRPGEDHQHFVVEEFLPLRVVLRHVHVDDDLLALLVHRDRQVRGVQHAAGARDENRKTVRPQERMQFGSIFDLLPTLRGRS